MNNTHFGAKITVGDLSPNYARTKRKVHSYANSLDTKYAHFPDDALQISISGSRTRWFSESGRDLHQYTPTVTATVKLRNAATNRARTTSITRKAGEVCDEPLWKFFWRVKKETNKLIKAAGLKSDQ